MTYLQAPDEFRGTSVQVCGLWPFAAGTGTPMVGVPLGRNITSGATMCADPISWFRRTALISNPSCFVLGLPGLGKSSLVRRMALGLAGYGAMPMVLGDLKPDYVDLVEALGGQVIRLGRGRGYLNVLDASDAQLAASRLPQSAREEVLADAHGRRHNMICTLLTIGRSAAPTDREEALLDRAIRLLDDRHDGIPVLADLIAVISDAPHELRVIAQDRGDIDRYRDATDALLGSLEYLTGGGRIGEIFARPTTVSMQLDRPVVFDVSSIDDGQQDLQAAALVACWSYGFGALDVAQALADAGLEPQRHPFVILDELWRALRAGQGIVDRIDALTRLNRQRGVGVAMVSHTMSDLVALGAQDREKARGFVERAGMLFCGGLPRAEMPMLSEVVRFSAAEQDMLAGWSTPPSWNTNVAGQHDERPGRGHFLVKVGQRPGIPIHVALTDAERAINDTNKRWHSPAPAAQELPS